MLVCSLFTAQAQETDTVLFARDSVIELVTRSTDILFGHGEKLADPAKIMVTTPARKTISLAKLMETGNNEYVNHTISDLDGDGKKELLILNNPNGQPVDELWFCKQITPYKYQYTAKLTGGRVSPTLDKKWIYDISPVFDGFYTCKGCKYPDESDEAPIPMKEITVRYSKGKLIIEKADQELRSIINDNLGKLGEKLAPIKPEEDDDGTRREIAMNLAVYYYTTGKNLTATKTVFRKYYKAPDAATIWSAFTKRLQKINSQVSF